MVRAVSQRQPDYEALRAQQARSQQADRIGPNQEPNDRHEEDA